MVLSTTPSVPGATQGKSLADELATEFAEWLLKVPPQEVSQSLVLQELARFVVRVYGLGYAAGRKPEEQPQLTHAGRAPLNTAAITAPAKHRAAKARPALYHLPCRICGAYYTED